MRSNNFIAVALDFLDSNYPPISDSWAAGGTTSGCVLEEAVNMGLQKDGRKHWNS